MGLFAKIFGGSNAKSKYDYGKNVVGDEELDLLEEGIDYLHARFEEKGWNETKVYKSLPEWYADIETLWLFKCELLNGGVYQYFNNSSSEGFPDIKRIYDQFKDPKIIKFIDDADMANQGLLKLRKMNARDIEIDEFIEKHHHVLDDEFYEGLDGVFFDEAHEYILGKLKNDGSICFPLLN